MTPKPLDGIRVVDLTRVLAGPYCTMILGDLGAEIIKVEAPATGDDSRHFGPFLDKEGKKSAYFISINCGKESVTPDLKTEPGRKVLADLIKKADVLVENFRPGTLERLGFSEERVKQLNPAIIYATASGFGYSGPDSSSAAYDMIIQSLSGLMSITGTEEGQCVRVGSSIADIVTGLYTAIGIVAALFRRSRTGLGARIDVAMLDSTVSALENAIARYQATREVPRPLGSRHPSITPFESFKTQDSTIVIAAGNDRLFASLCRVLGKPELSADPRFATNAARTAHFRELREIINACLATGATGHWLKALHESHVPCAKVNTVEDLFACRQLKARNMLVPVEGENDFKVAGNPVKFRGEPDVLKKERAPALGEHNDKILTEVLGYSREQIKMLYETGAVTR
jgi:CoA:oxalate CoA-transferase